MQDPTLLSSEDLLATFRNQDYMFISRQANECELAREKHEHLKRMDDFYVDFLACHSPHGKNVFHEGLKRGPLRSVVSVSTEAYALWDRENHAKTYDSSSGIGKGGYGKYTPKGLGAKQFSGVTDEGLKRFTYLCQQVQLSRKLDGRKHYESRLQAKMVNASDSGEKAKRKLEPPQSFEIFNELDVLRENIKKRKVVDFVPDMASEDSSNYVDAEGALAAV